MKESQAASTVKGQPDSLEQYYLPTLPGQWYSVINNLIPNHSQKKNFLFLILLGIHAQF